MSQTFDENTNPGPQFSSDEEDYVSSSEINEMNNEVLMFKKIPQHRQKPQENDSRSQHENQKENENDVDKRNLGTDKASNVPSTPDPKKVSDTQGTFEFRNIPLPNVIRWAKKKTSEIATPKSKSKSTSTSTSTSTSAPAPAESTTSAPTSPDTTTTSSFHDKIPQLEKQFEKYSNSVVESLTKMIELQKKRDSEESSLQDNIKVCVFKSVDQSFTERD